MDSRLIIGYAAIILSLFFISGLATTNILRLTKGNTLPINSKKCNCSICGGKITPLMQTPIISYILYKGKCKYCNTSIPLNGLVLEIITCVGMTLIAALFRFSPLGILWGFLYYELLRIMFILVLGKRETEFAKQYVIAVLSMLPFLCIVEFEALIIEFV